MTGYPDGRQRALAAEARQHYIEGRREESLRCNRELAFASIELGDRYGEIQGRRFEGLCLYRLDKWQESLAALEAAQDLAVREGCAELGLYIANHKGATLRRMGRIPEALETFRTALGAARTANAHEARTRLLGSLGALYDELGERERADDCYARYEELVERLGLPATRLANARGLAGRAARLRQDWDEARWRFEDEARLGRETGDRGKQIDAACHLADLACDEENWTEAEARVAEAFALARDSDKARVRRARWLAADIALERGDLAAAHDRHVEARQVIDHSTASDHLELLRSEAELASRAGLHGAALELLVEAVEVMRRLYTGFDDPQLGKLGQRRMQELGSLAEALSVEARRVDRTPEERRRVEAALTAVLGARRANPPPVDPWMWTDEARRRAEELWRGLLGESYTGLHDNSRKDLIRAELAYHGAIDDLDRAAHLLALVVERELRERFAPAVRARLRKPAATEPEAVRSLRERRQPPSLGTLASLMEWLLKAPRDEIGQDLGRYRDEHAVALDDIRSSFRAIPRSDGTLLRLVTMRNQAVHGDSAKPLTRIDVDAIKRHLVLAHPRPLARLVALPLPGT